MSFESEEKSLNLLLGLLEQAMNIFPDHPSGLIVQHKLLNLSQLFRTSMKKGSEALQAQNWQEALQFFEQANKIEAGSGVLKIKIEQLQKIKSMKYEIDKIKKQLEKRLSQTNDPVIFNSGELADSLAMDHLTGVGREFIPWFANTTNGYLFMLTKSDNVDGIRDFDHKGRTIVAWSMNHESISKKYEIGAPTFERRLNAAIKVQNAGYPLRIRLDPIVPFDGWEKAYAETIKSIFDKISPERMTIGTLRFEKGFYGMRNTIFTTGPELPGILDNMEPMFEPKLFDGLKTPKSGKYSFSEDMRIEIFKFVIDEIRKYSNCKIALCKESAQVWDATGLEFSKCSCVCQMDYADMS